jgi:hypothetical protein
MVDTRLQLYLLSPSKFAKISQAARLFRLKAIRPKRRCSLRDIQRVCGLGNSVCFAVTDDRLHLRDLFDCASAATSSRRVTLYHQSLRDLAWRGDLPTNAYVGRGIWDASPSATLVTDASMEGWGPCCTLNQRGTRTPRAARHTRQGPACTRVLGRPYPPDGFPYPRMRSRPPSTNGSCSPRYGTQDVPSLFARQQRVQLFSDSQVALAVFRNWTCRSPRVMVLLRILRRLCEENAISLGLQYISSVLNIWADKLSRSRLSSDWALTPSSLAKIRNHLPHHHNITIHSQVFARRDTSGPGRPPLPLSHRHGKPGPAGKTLPQLDGQAPWPAEMGLTLVTPTPAHAGLVLRHLRHAPSDAAVVVPDWPAQHWHQPSMRAAATTILLVGPVWRRARHSKKVLYYENSP